MLGILVQRNGDEVTLRCRGALVAGRASSLLRSTVKMRRERQVLLDLIHVSSIDAAGLGLLVELHHSLAACGKKLKLARVSPRVRRTIYLVNLQRVLDVCDGHAAAA